MHYEINRTRELKTMKWIPIPIDLAEDGYTEIMSEEDGTSIFGAWIACILLASSCEPRGTLFRKTTGLPHDAATISRQTRVPEIIVKRMLDFCTNNNKWLEIIDLDIDTCDNPAPTCDNPAPTCDNPAPTCAVHNITLHNITLDNITLDKKTNNKIDCSLLYENKNINKNINENEYEYANEEGKKYTVQKTSEEIKNENEEKLKQRERNFAKSIMLHSEYPVEMLNKFMSYWTEPTKSKTKMRFETEKTWDTTRRLKTWSDRSREFKANKFGKNEISNQELMDQYKRLKDRLK